MRACALLCAVLALGCGEEERPRRPSLWILRTAAFEAEGPLYVDGVAIAVGDARNVPLRYERGQFVSVVETEVATPCGPQRIALRLENEGNGRAAAWIPSGASLARARLWIDARDAQATEVGVGSQRFPVEAGSSGSVDIVEPSCAAGRAITIGGTPAGDLPPPHARSSGTAHYVVAIDEERCYRVVTHVYRQFGGARPEDPEPEDVRGRVIAVPGLDHFLEPAPSSLTEIVGEHDEREATRV